MRSMTVAAPLLLLAYGICRWFDGRDGDRGDGWAWNVGHVCFLLSVLLFTVLAVTLRRVSNHRAVATAALVAVVTGAACFTWVIIGDLFDAFRREWPLPDPLGAIGPSLFTLGMLTLLVSEVVARRLAWWSPVLFLLGFVAISVDLDWLPVAAVLITSATVPLARPVAAAPSRVTR